MKVITVTLTLLMSTSALAQSVCEPFPTSQAALDKNQEMVRALNDELQTTNSKTRANQLSDIITGVLSANQNLIDACLEASNQ